MDGRLSEGACGGPSIHIRGRGLHRVGRDRRLGAAPHSDAPKPHLGAGRRMASLGAGLRGALQGQPLPPHGDLRTAPHPERGLGTGASEARAEGGSGGHTGESSAGWEGRGCGRSLLGLVIGSSAPGSPQSTTGDRLSSNSGSEATWCHLLLDTSPGENSAGVLARG